MTRGTSTDRLPRSLADVSLENQTGRKIFVLVIYSVVLKGKEKADSVGIHRIEISEWQV